MSARAASWLAWMLWTLTVVFSVLSLLMPTTHNNLTALLPLGVWSVASSTVGTFIVSRRFENPIGWILCVMGFLWASNVFFGLYAIRALVTYPGSLPAGEVAAWVSTWLVYPALGLLVYLFLLFPDGRPLSPRWRLLLWINGVLMVANIIVGAFTPGPTEGLEGVRNPLGMEGYAEALEFVGDMLSYASDALLLVSIISVYLRLRRVSGATRQQIKWLAYAAALLGIVILFGVAGDVLFGGLGLWFFLVVLAAFLGLPLSIGVAVLRYRLYGIDVIINRTLVYGVLTVSLAVMYFGGVAGLERLLSPLAGESNQLATVASTLAIAALFNPLRRRIQSFIDRLFYRKKYDAAKALEAFSLKLRDETNLKSITEEVVSVVHDTMRPDHASLWLRPPKDRT